MSPLGWTTQHPDPIPQEAEAYCHQKRVGYELSLLRVTPRWLALTEHLLIGSVEAGLMV